MNITFLTPDENGLVDWPTLSTSKKSVVTVGGFDGMHRGHRAVIERVVELAKATGSFSVAIMFDPRPSVVHRYAAAHYNSEPGPDFRDSDALTSANQRIRVMRELGVDHVLVVRYSLAFAAKSFRFFLGQLVGKLGMRTIVLGADAAMGANRTGDVKAIENLAQATGVFELDVVDDRGPGYVRIPATIVPQAPVEPGEPVDPAEGMTKAELRAWSKEHQGRKVRVWSSSNVRYLLSQGRVRDAGRILGCSYGIEGIVVHGENSGVDRIGFPTANLGQTIEGYLPVDGVYAGWLIDLGEPQQPDDSVAPSEEMRLAARSTWRWPAAISIGTKPTFSETTGLNARVVESYAITDRHLDLYGHKLRIEFAGFLRPQIKFDGVDELKAALARDVEDTLTLTKQQG
ncbi:riboflavin kinase [Bifidobacterium sp.]|jgi:riboflavin kinase/FMN adenylyltransferase|uniref:riboflavin kinase n=1 Tax=Bifidobacterium sp. TaxID=41200 RepID=UPI0025C592B0|nr:riboflavin kinase [Bifidobacterium sp.]MCH4208976.1 bifunctional riboflavin kinase/FMN adenylyltransferase [Bifidobacterium sp.]MCI1224941.1 bifunctional riboflavin kinase/FMN adenylyltransferase [Bifidobacterium sp.]